MSVERALSRLLAHSGWRARRLGPSLWRIEPAGIRAQVVARPAREPMPPATEFGTSSDIVVTGAKIPRTLADASLSLSIVGSDRLTMFGSAPDTGALATMINGLFATNLGAGRDRLFVRGVADGPFDGFAQSSVSVYLGEIRATYDAPDPDLRLVDMQQVEVLKGPQGPLYGTGALGGVYRMVPAQPDVTTHNGWVQVQTDLTDHAGPAGSIEAMINVPLIADRLAVRALAYDIGQAGWIDQSQERGINHGRTTGGRLALAGDIGRWAIQFNGATQFSFVRDSQYVEGRDTLVRAARLAEPQDTDFTAIGATAKGPLGEATLTLTAGSAWQELQATYDASAKALLLGVAAPATYLDQRHYHVQSAEARLAGRTATLDWIVGLSLLDAGTAATGALQSPGGAPPSTILRFNRNVDEQAIFTEITGHATPALWGTLGLRVFRSAVDDHRRDDRTSDTEGRYANDVIRVSPSASLSWKPSATSLVFLRYASALRPGGVQAPDGNNATLPYSADTLCETDLGLRLNGAGPWSLDATVFMSRWTNVQADSLGTNGLISTRNIGEARNLGMDVSLGWMLARGVKLSGGLLVQHARIEAGTTIADDRRLPVIPDLAGHGEIVVTRTIADWTWSGAIRARYAGDARLGFGPALNRETEANLLLGASVDARRGRWAWRVGIENLADSRADTFAYGNPFTVSATDQRTPLRPRTITGSIRRSF